MGDIEHWQMMLDAANEATMRNKTEAESWQRLAEDNGAEAGRRAEEVNALRRQLRGAVDALREWIAASDALKAVDTSDGEAIKAALDRVDAAKAVARRLGGQ